MPAQYDINAYQGDTFILAFHISGDFTAQTPRMQLRTTPSASTATIDLTSPTGISMTYNGVTGKTLVQATITATQMAALVPSTIYYYDFQFTNGAVVSTYLAGNFSICPEVTR